MITYRQEIIMSIGLLEYIKQKESLINGLWTLTRIIHG